MIIINFNNKKKYIYFISKQFMCAKVKENVYFFLPEQVSSSQSSHIVFEKLVTKIQVQFRFYSNFEEFSTRKSFFRKVNKNFLPLRVFIASIDPIKFF